MASAGDPDWILAQQTANFQKAWLISDQSLRAYCKSGVVKHTGERHLQRIWQGESLCGKRVLVRCYHGLGDTIQFIRFAKPLREIAYEVIVWAQPELIALLRTVDGIDKILPLHNGTPDVDFDVDIEVMELAHALRVSRKLVSSRVPYFSGVNTGLQTSRSSQSLSIGLVWEVGDWDRRRCVPPQILSCLHAIPGVRLYSLQQGPGRAKAIDIPAEDLAVPDLETLAGTILNLDLIITVDTMVAHLAGALGASVWTMLHADCDWRWPKTGKTSIWYPTMKLFHQRTAGDWIPVMNEIANELCRNFSVSEENVSGSRLTDLRFSGSAFR